MFALISRLRRKRQSVPAVSPVLGDGSTALLHAMILDALSSAEANGRAVTLRDLHRMVGHSQPDTLRAVAELRAMQKIAVETMILDPLAGTVRLK